MLKWLRPPHQFKDAGELPVMNGAKPPSAVTVATQSVYAALAGREQASRRAVGSPVGRDRLGTRRPGPCHATASGLGGTTPKEQMDGKDATRAKTGTKCEAVTSCSHQDRQSVSKTESSPPPPRFPAGYPCKPPSKNRAAAPAVTRPRVRSPGAGVNILIGAFWAWAE